MGIYRLIRTIIQWIEALYSVKPDPFLSVELYNITYKTNIIFLKNSCINFAVFLFLDLIYTETSLNQIILLGIRAWFSKNAVSFFCPYRSISLFWIIANIDGAQKKVEILSLIRKIPFRYMYSLECEFIPIRLTCGPTKTPRFWPLKPKSLVFYTLVSDSHCNM